MYVLEILVFITLFIVVALCIGKFDSNLTKDDEINSSLF